MKSPTNKTQPAVNRSLETLKRDLKKFIDKFFGNTKFAKEANNVIDDIYFDIPLNQVYNKEKFLIPFNSWFHV